MKKQTTADTDARPSTHCRQTTFEFQALGARKVALDFTGGHLSSDGGAVLLRQVDHSIGLSRLLADCFVDRRNALFVEHWVRELVAQRLNSLALGYEDLIDHADPQRDRLLAQATAGTIRVQLLMIAAHVTVSVRRVHVRLASAFARQDVFARAHAQLLAWGDSG